MLTVATNKAGRRASAAPRLSASMAYVPRGRGRTSQLCQRQGATKLRTHERLHRPDSWQQRHCSPRFVPLSPHRRASMWAPLALGGCRCKMRRRALGGGLAPQRSAGRLPLRSALSEVPNVRPQRMGSTGSTHPLRARILQRLSGEQMILRKNFAITWKITNNSLSSGLSGCVS